VNAVVGTLFASRLIDPNLAPRAINNAFRLYMLPHGLFAVAVTTVLFPMLARLAARDERDEFAGAVGSGMRQIGFLMIPASVVSVVLAEPIVRLVFERGRFESIDTPIVAAALAAFSAGLVFNGWMLLLNRAFYSLQESWIPTVVAGLNVALNVGLYAVFYRVGVWGIPLAVSIANVVGTVLLYRYLVPRIGGLDTRAILDTVARVVAASVPTAAASFGVWWALDRVLGRSVGGQLVSVALGLVAGGGAYVGSCRLLHVRELEALLRIRRSR
jgi:putative peptidoglycan lipid II flippase